jgi:hypothetical protein
MTETSKAEAKGYYRDEKVSRLNLRPNRGKKSNHNVKKSSCKPEEKKEMDILETEKRWSQQGQAPTLSQGESTTD